MPCRSASASAARAARLRAVQGDLGGVRARAGDAQLVGGGHGDLVVEADGEEDVGQVVEAVRAARADRELDVDLGGDADGPIGHGVRHLRATAVAVDRSSSGAGSAARRPPRSRSPTRPRGLCSAMAANSSTVSASPRACGETPAATRAASAAAADRPSRPARRAASCGAARRPRRPPRRPRSGRRWSDRLGPPDQGDQAGVDVGRRPEDVAADGAGPLDLGVPVAFTDGTP